MNFRYVITGKNSRAIVVHSDKNWIEMEGYVRQQSQYLHEDSHLRVFRMGVTELVDPQVMTLEDFANHCPYIIP